MVCSNQHTYCSVCIIRMLNSQKNNCPECRTNITGGNVNLHLKLLLSKLGETDTGYKIKNE